MLYELFFNPYVPELVKSDNQELNMSLSKTKQ